MRFMVLVKASKESEAGELPGQELLEAMGSYNEELVRSGIMLAGEGLRASSEGVRIRFDGDKRSVIDGPFDEAEDLIAGFWILQVTSRDEVIEWVRKAPFREGEVEIRRLFETEDFAPSDPTGELREAEHRLRDELERRADR